MGDGSSGQDGPGEPVARLRSRSIDAVAQRVELLVRELDRGGGEVVLQVLDAGCSRDGEDHRRRFNNQARASWGGVASSSLLSSSSGPPGGRATNAHGGVQRSEQISRFRASSLDHGQRLRAKSGKPRLLEAAVLEGETRDQRLKTTPVQRPRRRRACGWIESEEDRETATSGPAPGGFAGRRARREAARNRPVRYLVSDQAQRDLRPLVPRGQRGSLEGLTEEGRRSWTSWWCTNRATATPI